MSVMSWLNRFKVTPESVLSKKDCGARMTDLSSVPCKAFADTVVTFIYSILFRLAHPFWWKHSDSTTY